MCLAELIQAKVPLWPKKISGALMTYKRGIDKNNISLIRPEKSCTSMAKYHPEKSLQS
jgi:hypothetical protein